MRRRQRIPPICSSRSSRFDKFVSLCFQAKKVPNRIVLFEFDKRFGDLYGDRFSFYDVHHPRAIDKKYIGAFDFVVVDPPYLVRPCLIDLRCDIIYVVLIIHALDEVV
jgi:hypothetical protein